MNVGKFEVESHHNTIYHQTSNISFTEFPQLNVSGLIMQLPLPNPLKTIVENEDVVGAVPTGDAQATSEKPTVLLPTKESYIRGLMVYSTKYSQ